MGKIIIALRHLEDLSEAKRLFLETGSQAEFICFSPQILYSLKEDLSGYPHIYSIWDFIDDGILEEIYSETWYHISALFDDNNRSFLDSLSWHLILFIYELLASDFSIRGMLEKEHPAKVYVFSPPDPYPIIPQAYQRLDLDRTLEFCLIYHARKSRIDLSVMSSSIKPPPPPEFFRERKGPLLKFLWYWYRIRGILNLLKIIILSRPYIASYSSMVDYINLIPHLTRLKKDWDVLCFGWLSPEYFLRYRKNISWGLLTPRDLECAGLIFVKSKILEFRNVIIHFFEKLSEKYSIMPDHPIYSCQKEYLLKRAIPSVARLFRGVDVLCRISKPIAFLAANPFSWINNVFISCAPAGDPRVSIQHGGFGQLPSPEICRNADAVAVWGEVQKDLLRTAGFQGIFLRDFPPVEYNSQSESPRTIDAKSFTVLLATSAQSNFTAPCWMPEKAFFLCIQGLMDWAERTHGVRMRIRCHPRFDYRECYQIMIRNFKKVEMIPEHESTEESLNSASLVVFVGVFSTFLVHAAVHSIPLFVVLPKTSFHLASETIKSWIPHVDGLEQALDLLEHLRLGDMMQWKDLSDRSLAFGKNYTTLSESNIPVHEYLKQKTDIFFKQHKEDKGR